MKDIIDVGTVYENKEEAKEEFLKRKEEEKKIREKLYKELEETKAKEKEDEELNKASAKETVEKLAEYLMSSDFSDDCDKVAKKINVPKKKIANSFATKCLGTISDVLDIVFDTSGNVVTTLLKVLFNILTSAVSIVIKVAKALVGFITFGYTNKQKKA